MKLNGRWKVTHLPYQADLAPLLAPSFVPEGWLDAEIPEDIHATLRRAGAIRANTYDKHEAEEQWIEQCDWVYRKAFFAPEALRTGAPILLEFDGLDTLCEVFLNGQKLGEHANMHTPCRFDVSDGICLGERNVLTVRFFSAVKAVELLDDSNLFSITESDRLFVRKAQMNYSWDFCARCVTVGIWKDVRLEPAKPAAICSYYLYTKSVFESVAELGLEVETDAADARLEATLSLNGSAVYSRVGTPAEFAKSTLSIDAPQLWWPRPYGAQPLYDFSLRLIVDGVVVDQKEQRIGIRTIEVIEEPQNDGLSFCFAVNGRRLFLRGANWTPINTVYTEIRRDDYARLIHDAVEGRLSMLRIWGGGIYESPDLFELCDENGILLWNDFMFACGIYPHDERFLTNVAEEAEHVLRAYRNYTCLAIWAGDNENGQAYIWANRAYEFQNDAINTRVLREACARLDPHRYYLTTSPASPHENAKGGDNPESPYQGDLHLYIMSASKGVNSRRDYGHDYYKRVLGYRPRFMSEFGFVSLPEKDSYYRFNPRREPLRDPSEIVKFLPFTKEYLDRGDMEAVIYYSQVFNAMALQYWIEYFRSLKGVCQGTLYWKFNDPLADCPDRWMYPSHMCSVDMYGQKKMTYYYTRRAYADTLVLFREEGDALTVYAVSEELDVCRGRLTVTRRDFDGRVLASFAMDCEIAADCADRLYTVDAALGTPVDRFGEYLKAELVSGNETLENRYFFADLCEINQLRLPKGELTIREARLTGRQLTLRLYAKRYLRNVRINVLDARLDYSDNRFEMDADCEKAVTLRFLDTTELLDKAVYFEAENLERVVLPLASITRC